MRELPLLMNGPMVRATIEDRKTATRRVCRDQPHVTATGNGVAWPDGKGTDTITSGGAPGCYLDRAPYQVGDRLYVRETFALENDVDGGEPPHADGRPVLRRPDDDLDGIQPLWVQPHYRATDPAPDLACEKPGCAQCRDHDMGPHWRPAIHMPKWAARIWLEVTDVRVERLQDITAEHAIAEGMASHLREHDAVVDLRQQFADLWDGLAKPGTTWADNPWVWAVSFRRVEVARG